MLLRDPQPRFDEIYRIYKEVFPPVERRTRDGQKKVFGNVRYGVRVIEKYGEIVAFLGFWELPGSVFLEHLASARHCRGKGYGKHLVMEALRETKKQKPVFLEIEPVTEEDPMTGRRAGFYERLGFSINSFSYEQMPLKPSDSPIPLWVMSYGGTMTEEEFKPYKKEIYEIVYGVFSS